MLETCTFPWLATDDPKLPAQARECRLDPDNAVCFSALSAWEIAIKRRLGRLPLPLPSDVYVTSRHEWLGIEQLPFDENCAAHDDRLPQYHPDPFDRGLVAQAVLNGMTIVTPDPSIRIHPVPTQR